MSYYLAKTLYDVWMGISHDSNHIDMFSALTVLKICIITKGLFHGKTFINSTL